MTSILDRFKPAGAAFLPATTQDLFALRLAQKLGDIKAAAHYVSLVAEYSEFQMLVAYRRTIRESSMDPGRRFHEELKRVHANGHQAWATTSIAIRVERRTIAAAVFRGDHLEYTDARQLSSSRDKALSSAVGFIAWILARFTVETTALETVVEGPEIQRRLLHESICAELRDHGLPIWEIPKSVLLDGCGYPTLKSRQQLRTIATSIWPVLEGTHARLFIQDAAILGLHAQIERHFILN